MDDDTGRAIDGESQRIRNRVVDMDRFDREAAERDLLARADLVEDGAGRQAMLFEFILDKADREPCGVNRHIEFFQQIRQAADVILVSVGDEQTLDTVFVLKHIGEVRDDKIDTEHIIFRKNRTAVHENHIALALIQGDVFTDLAQTAQRADVHGDGRGHLVMFLLLGLAAAALALGARRGCLAVCRILHIARAARTRGRDTLCSGGVLLCGSSRARLAGAGLMLRVGSVFPLGLRRTRLARLRCAACVLGIGCTIFTFLLELFHR